MALMAGGVVVAIIASANVMVWWERSELATIKENLAQVDKLRGQIKIQNCDGQPCVETVRVYDKNPSFYILKNVKF